MVPKVKNRGLSHSVWSLGKVNLASPKVKNVCAYVYVYLQLSLYKKLSYHIIDSTVTKKKKTRYLK